MTSGQRILEQPKESRLTYAVEQRLRLIDFLLHHYGSVSRGELMDYFGVGEATATRDFSTYNALAPENALLNQSSKRWVKADTFKRVWA